MGRATNRKERMSGALRRNMEHMGWKRYYFRGWGKLQGEVQLCLTTWERLQPKTSLMALLPKVSYVGELVVGKGMGSGGPRSLRGHGS